jgi:outer membrane beta-barrel protein
MKNLFVLILLIHAPLALAKDKAEAPQAEQVDVDAIKEKYWARGEEAELGVVQNRTYSKAKKFHLGVMGGFVTSDPFLSVKAVGGTFGYHFNETFGLSFVGFKHLVSDSSAFDTFKQFRNATTNTNEPRYYLGAEIDFNFLYGKLSLLGKKIIYYDMYLLGGFGTTQTESGRYMTPSGGIGQRFFLNRIMSLRVDYRLMYYKETIIEKEIPQKLGEPQGQRGNWNNVITLGLDFMFGPGASSGEAAK